VYFVLAAVLVTGAPPQEKGVGDLVLAAVKKDLTDPNKPFTLLIKVTTKEGQAKKFEAAMAQAIKETRKEKGNLTYELSNTPSSPRYVIYERWENLAALEAHLKTAHYKKAIDAVATLLEDGITVELLVPVAVSD
jgi:autoinducer 2-degrading protein